MPAIEAWKVTWQPFPLQPLILKPEVALRLTLPVSAHDISDPRWPSYSGWKTGIFSISWHTSVVSRASNRSYQRLPAFAVRANYWYVPSSAVSAATRGIRSIAICGPSPGHGGRTPSDSASLSMISPAVRSGSVSPGCCAMPRWEPPGTRSRVCLPHH